VIDEMGLGVCIIYTYTYIFGYEARILVFNNLNPVVGTSRVSF
jgi:hypothetical protein